MTRTENRTIVGVPFYDGEGMEVLAACLSNLDRCLNFLKLDAKIVVGINGPRVSMGKSPLSYELDKSKYNADIKFIKTRPGLVAAEKAICSEAGSEGHQRIFLTDADISRLPISLLHLWNSGDHAVVGANYATYPLEILTEAGFNLTPEETALLKIFEADKHPLAREFTWGHRPKKRLKGSLLLVDIGRVSTMFGNQNITSDSRMNDNVPETDKQLVREAAFLHFGRVSLLDHIQARLRHFHAAASEGQLDSFTKKSEMYSHRSAEDIAHQILDKYPQATEVASNFLLQCALRHQVAAMCRAIASGKQPQKDFHVAPVKVDLTSEVHTYTEANLKMAALLSQVNLGTLNSEVTNGKSTTQNDSRIPIDLGPFLKSEWHRRLILSHLGLDDETEV